MSSSKVYSNQIFYSKKVLFAIVDQTNLRTKCFSLYQKMCNITLTLTQRKSIVLSKPKVKVFDTIDNAMIAGESFDLVIIQNVGNFISHNTMFEYIESYWKDNPDFYLIAFTLDWDSEHGSGWIECHHQMIIVNVSTWRSIGRPKFGDWEETTEALPNYSRSIENFHDNYTPYWIKGEPDTTIKRRTKQGWGFIKAGLENGLKIDNFSHQMRSCRMYLYPETDSEILYNAIIQKNSVGLQNPNQIKWISELNARPKVWIFNSEHYTFDTSISNIDTYFGPAAGFKYLEMLVYNDNVDYILYDYNQLSLDWIKELRENWDGENLSFYLRSKPVEIQQQYQYIYESIEINEKILIDSFGGPNNFKKLWKRFQLSNVKFICSNLLNEDDVETLIKENANGRVFFYFSNIFATDYLIYNNLSSEINQKFSKFTKKLIVYPLIKILGTDPTGKWVTLGNIND